MVAGPSLKLAITLTDCCEGDRERDVNAWPPNWDNRPNGAPRLGKSSRRPTRLTTSFGVLSPLEML